MGPLYANTSGTHKAVKHPNDEQYGPFRKIIFRYASYDVLLASGIIPRKPFANLCIHVSLTSLNMNPRSGGSRCRARRRCALSRSLFQRVPAADDGVIRMPDSPEIIDVDDEQDNQDGIKSEAGDEADEGEEDVGGEGRRALEAHEERLRAIRVSRSEAFSPYAGSS